MANSVTFRRDFYPLFSYYWTMAFVLACLSDVVNKLFRSLPAVVFSIIIPLICLLVLMSILALFFERRKIAVIDQSGLHLFTASPFADNEFVIDWKAIRKAEIASRETYKIVFIHNFFSKARFNFDTLVIHLNSPLPPQRAELFRQITSKWLSSEQLISNDDKSEIWVTQGPRYGFNAILRELSKYTKTPSVIADNSKEIAKTMSQHFVTHVILWPAILIYLYFTNC